jgi:hypothetical protein
VAAEKARRAAWSPLPGPQTQALESAADVVGYGGAAGGGKSDLILGLPLTRHRKAIVFRREFVQLRDIASRAKDILAAAPDPGQFNGSALTWKFADGRQLELGAVQHPDDWRKYRGRPHDFIGFDEATEFLESQVRALSGWLRTTVPGQRCRIVLTFNPPTHADGQWVIRYFAPWLDRKHPRPAAPGELRWYAMVGGKEVERPDGAPFDHDGAAVAPQSRTFIPARLADNPHLVATGYGRQLENLPEPLRSQLLFGDFDAGVADDPWQAVPTAWVEAAMARWPGRSPAGPITCLGLDVAHGGKDQTVIARRHDAYFAVLLAYPGSATPDGRSAAALVAAAIDAPDCPINVDAIGYGASAAERLKDKPPEGHGLLAHPVNVAAKSAFRDRSGKFGMVNLRAEMYWRLREALDPESGQEMALPPDAELKADLCAPRYEIAPAGIRVEAKPDIIARLGRSPDRGDAVALAMLTFRREIRIY